ncbi:high affinity immunoglobulin gamma Fc receptor I-like isoform 2-T3 [Leptodactylus fuscus]|uniref:high affinity immunoglobulin gamma Fc receptor I-like isoform X2 n=1 Tax=Leptodactylus fuscus TaxID=238119 RepID=UPI003F4E9418
MYVISLTLLVLLTLEHIGAVVTPIVTFDPDWNKIFTGESITLTCDVDEDAEDATYHWFKDGYWIHSGKTYIISSAQTSNSGNYQCQTSSGSKSDPVRLDVHNSYAILQAPLRVYEGDNLTLRCHQYPGYPAKQTIFYKNGAVIQDWGEEEELYIENVSVTANSKYKCIKEVKHNLLYYQPSDETSISVLDLFSLPTIRLSPDSVTEGDPMTLTCDVRLSPLRQTKVLQFAFYHDGQNIQDFSSSNKFETLSTQRYDSGDYKCVVKTYHSEMRKMSETVTIQVKRNGARGTSLAATVFSVTSLVLILIIVLIFLYRKRCFLPDINQHLPNVSYVPQTEFKEANDETENIYTDLDTHNRWTNDSLTLCKPDGNKLVVESHIIV